MTNQKQNRKQKRTKKNQKTTKRKIKKKKKSLKISKLEKEYLSKYSSIIGIDEVGRGCMAGPLVLAGFKLTLNHTPLKNVHDSKIVKKEIRQELYPKLKQHPHFIHQATVEEIDKEGLSNPIRRGVLNIRRELADDNSLIIVDGNLKFIEFEDIISVVDADALLYSVAAASIIAKVFRDDLMTEYSEIYPEYGFDTHVGYATKKHRDAVINHGVLNIHRKRYKFIRDLPEITDQETLFD